MENAMYVHFTDTQVILSGLALFLIVIFASSAFLDKRWRTAPLRGSALTKADSLLHSCSCDDEDGSSEL
jgi:hypothetical protein